MDAFEVLLNNSAAAHGHLCPGQAVGVRMAMLGCRLIGLDEPTRHDQIKKLIVYVEMDRCTADAIAHVTGVKLGRRSLKFVDYGIMAATFMNLETGQTFRVISTEEARSLARAYAPEIADKYPSSWKLTNACRTVFYFGCSKLTYPSVNSTCPVPPATRLPAVGALRWCVITGR